jgi:hypothetical protein
LFIKGLEYCFINLHGIVFLLLIELGWGGMGAMIFFALAMNSNAYFGDVQKDN